VPLTSTALKDSIIRRSNSVQIRPVFEKKE
jgi:hypothetical protein